MTIAVIAVATELNIDLSHLEVLGLGRDAADKKRDWHQHRSGKRRDKGNLRHGLLLRLIQTNKGERFRASFRFVSGRAHITVSGNCLGLLASLLKFHEKVSQPRGQRSLNGVVLTEALPDCPLNID
jgi:hypothetical protein